MESRTTRTLYTSCWYCTVMEKMLCMPNTPLLVARAHDCSIARWEPPKSFKGGSEHFIDHFWSRIDTNGRDYNNLRDFNVGEEFFPSGPPRKSCTLGFPFTRLTVNAGRKKAKKDKAEEQHSSTPSVIEINDSEDDVREIEEGVQEPRTKKGKRRRSSAAATVEPTEPMRKRGRPPGIRPEELEVTGRSLGSRRSAPNLRGGTSRARDATAGESAAVSPPKRTSPRKRGRTSKSAPQSSTSDDELLLSPQSKRKGRTPRGKKQNETSTPDAMDVDEADTPSPFGEPTLLGAPPVQEVPEVPAASSSEPLLPAHRVRAANPRVKVTDDPNLTETQGTAISVKARFMKRAAANGDASGDSSARISSSKAGPGRSSSGLVVGGSRLTVQKGKLTTVKPRKPRAAKAGVTSTADPDQNMPDVRELDLTDPAPAPLPPTADELLRAAGANRDDVADLPDFEDDADGETDAEYVGRCACIVLILIASFRRVVQVLQVNQDDPVNSDPAATTPAPVLEARPVTFASRVSAAWNHSTIFGPLFVHSISCVSTGELTSPRQCPRLQW